MKSPKIESVEPLVLAVEKAVDIALQCSFDEDTCLELTLRLDGLYSTFLDKGESLPIGIEDDNSLFSKALVMADIAYICWLNDEPAIQLPPEVQLNHAARMKLNYDHCKMVIEFSRLFLKKHGKLLSVEASSLLLPR